MIEQSRFSLLSTNLDGDFATHASQASVTAAQHLPPNATYSAVVDAVTELYPLHALVVPAGLAILLLVSSICLLATDILTPHNLLPLKWLVLGRGPTYKREALIGGPNVWLWGCLLCAVAHIAQIVLEVRLGRFCVTSIAWLFWRDVAFWTLFTTCLITTLSSIHSIPLLLSTRTYVAPSALSKPLAAPLITTLPTLLLPSALFGLLLTSTIQSNQQVAGLQSSTQSFLASSRTGEMVEQSFEAVQESMLKLVSPTPLRGWTILAALALLFIHVLLVEGKIWFRLWSLVQNAKAEEQRAFTLFELEVARQSLIEASSEASVTSTSVKDVEIHPHHRLSAIVQDQFDSLPTLLKHPAPTRPRYPTSRKSKVHRTSSYSSGSQASSSYSSNIGSASSELSHISYLDPDTPSSSVPRWPDDVVLLQPHEELGANIPSYPAAAFLVRKSRSRTRRFCKLDRGSFEPEEEVIWNPSAESVTPLFCQSKRGNSIAMRRHSSTSSSATSTSSFVSLSSESDYGWDAKSFSEGSSGGWVTEEQAKEYDVLDYQEQPIVEEAPAMSRYLPWVGSSSSYASTSSFKSTTGLLAPQNTLWREGDGYAGPSSEIFRDMRRNRGKDTLAVLILLCVYGVFHMSQTSFQASILRSPKLWVFLTVLSHLLPILAGQIILIVVFLRDLGSREAGTLRGGKQDGVRSCWIPTQETEPLRTKRRGEIA